MNNIAAQVRPAIVVMAKVPRAGDVKTRLLPFLNAAQAAELAACFLRDTISNARNAAENIIVAFTPSSRRETLESILPENLILIEQKGDDLGARLEFAVEYAGNQNFSPVVVIGADSPTLPEEYIKVAVESFKSGETGIALGATADGGFYLIGLRRKHSGLFENVAWSTGAVFEQTRANAARLELELFQLPDWYDIDTPDDLFRLREELLADKAAQTRTPQTFQWLLSNSALFDAA